MMRDENMWGSGNNDDDDVGLPDMSDMPTGRFNPDDLEFESFMFDQGEGPSTAVQAGQPVSGWSAQAGSAPASAVQMDSPPFVGQASMPPMPTSQQPAPMGIAGQSQSVPVPPYLQGNEPGGAPFVSFVVPGGSPTGTGPLAGASMQAGGPTDMPPQAEAAATGADTTPSTKVGTGPLSSRVSGVSPAAPRGTGPLTQRISNAGSTGRRNLTSLSSDTPALHEQPEAQPAPMGADALFPGMSLHEGNVYGSQPAASLAPAAPEVAPHGTGPFSMSPMPYQNGAGAAVMDMPSSNDMGWSDGVLASVEDFSTVLIAMRSSKEWGATATTEVAPAPQEAEPAPVEEAQPREKSVPAWVERAALGEELAARLAAEAAPQVESQAVVVDAPQVEEDAAPPVSQEVEAQVEPVQAQMAVDAAPVGEEAETLPAVAEGSFGTSDLVFEQFMFDSGTTSAPLAEPDTEEAAPSMEPVEAMEAIEVEVEQAEQPVAYAEAPVEIELDVDPQEEQVAGLAEIHALEFKETGDDGAPLPFWLKDTSELGTNSSFLQEAAPSGVPDMFASPAVEAVEAEAPVEEPAEPEPVSMEPVAEVAMAEMAMSEMAMAEEATHDEPAPEEAPEDDYSDLPPIAPFDFTALNLAEQGESLGFNTEELLGIVPERHEGMRATTDLAALADLLGMNPASGVLREVPATASTANFGAVTGAIAEQEPAPTPIQPVMEEAPLENTTPVQEKASAAQPVDAGRTPSWTSTVTSHLSLDTEHDLTGKMVEGESGGGDADGTEKLAVADLDVDPFDFTQLNLDDDEVATGFLDTTKMKMPGTTVLEPAPEVQDTVEEERIEPFAEMYDSQQAEGGEESDGLPGDTLERDSELDTSFFLTAKPTGRKRGKATGRLDEASLQPVPDPAATPDEAGTEPSPAPVAPPADNSFKAKVLQTGKTERDMLTLHNLEAEEPVEVEAQAPGEQMAQVETNDDTEKPLAMGQAEEAAGPEEEENMGTQNNGRAEGQGGSGGAVAASMPSSRRDMMMSGPLPSLDGFDELQAMVAANPGDIGAHMALALAYTQVGDLDTALRVYRRILKKRAITPGVLQLIIEELSDLEGEATGRAHFHQVRGDLYMKQGRFQEAVQEYNKIS